MKIGVMFVTPNLFFVIFLRWLFIVNIRGEINKRTSICEVGNVNLSLYKGKVSVRAFSCKPTKSKLDYFL